MQVEEHLKYLLQTSFLTKLIFEGAMSHCAVMRQCDGRTELYVECHLTEHIVVNAIIVYCHYSILLRF